MFRSALWLVILLLGGLLLWGLPGSRAEGPALHVVYSGPQDRLEDPADGLVVTFDQPMVPLGPATAKSTGPIELNPPTTGVFRWIGVRTVAFIPNQLAPATEYTVRVPAGTRSLNGATLAEEHRWTFQTQRPELETSFPAGDGNYSRAQQKTVLVFNQPMNPERARPSLRLLDSKGKALPFKVSRWTQIPPTSSWSKENALLLEPARPLPAEHEYSWEIGEGTLAAVGNLGTDVPRTHSMRIPGPLRFVSAKHSGDPGDPVIVKFNNEVDPKELLRHVHVHPPAEPTSVGLYQTNEPHIPLSLRPDTRYVVTLDAQLPDTTGSRLGRPVKVVVKTGALAATLVAPVGPRTLESYLGGELPLGFLNVPQLRVRVSRVRPENAIALLRRYTDGDWRPGAPALDKTWKPRARRNRLTYAPLSLGPALKNGFGLLAVHYQPAAGTALLDSGSRYPSYQKSALIQVTRMGLTGKFSPDDVLIWVTDLEHGQSLPGVALELRDANNRVRWKGQSDAQGLARAPGWDRLGLVRGQRNLLVVARRGEDVALLHSDWTGEVPEHVERNWGEPVHVQAELFTDRGLYRPGDTVHVKGIVRRRQGPGWSVPGGEEFTLAVRDSRGENWTERRIQLSPRGSFQVDLDLPATARTGQWSLDLGDQERSSGFRVEAYRPAQFEVKLKPERVNWTYDDRLTMPVEARYLFGAPMAGAALNWRGYYARTTFTSPQWSSMHFGLDRWLTYLEEDSDEEEDSNESLHSSGETRLNAEGRTNVNLHLRPENLKGPLLVELEATAKAPDQSEVTGKTTLKLHPASFYIGLQPGATFLPAGSSVDVASVVVTPEEQPVAGKTVQLELLRREYRSVRKVGANGSEWVSVARDVPVDRAQLTSEATPVSRKLKLTSTPGLYVLRATARDERGRTAQTLTSLYAYGEELAGWREDVKTLELVPERRSYAPGETARVAISSPFPRARALVTVERDGVLERFVTDLQGGAPTVRIPIRAEYAPNVFVSVALIRGRTARNRFGPLGEDLAQPAFRLGAVKLLVEPKAQRLRVLVRPEKEQYLPGETVTAHVEVQDESGAPRPAEVTFVAADEGVLNLIDYHLPDPLKTFFAERGLSVETAETRQHVIGQRRYGEKGGPAGGGGLVAVAPNAEGSYRWNFEATPCWQPGLITDADGKTRVRFTLPDSLTTFRLSAVAHTADSRFGQGESEIRVAQPLSLTPSWPRFALVGDDGNLGVLIHNQSGQAGNATVSLAVKGGLQQKGDASQQVRLAAGESRAVRFPVSAASAGNVSFEFRSSMGALEDRLRITNWRVLTPHLEEAAALLETVPETGLQFPLNVPADAIPGSANLDLTLSTSALGNLQPAVRYLQAYPHECLEQKVSRVFPIVAARELLQAFGGDAERGRELVQEVLDSLPALRSTQGGLALWAGQNPSPWATAYALHLCQLARQQGYRVPLPTCKEALAYLRLLDEDSELWPETYDEEERQATLAYVQETLTLWGEPDAAAQNVLFAQRKQLSACAQAWLLRAMASRPKEADALAALLRNRLKVEPGGRYFQSLTSLRSIYDSPERTTAVLLQALLESGHDFPEAPNVIRWLLARRHKGRWSNTQENAMALQALSSWYRLHEKNAGSLEAAVRIAGQEVLHSAVGRSERKVVPVSVGDTLVQISRQGPGSLYASALLRYASRQPMPMADSGISVAKLVEPVEGQPDASGAYPVGALLRVRLIVASHEPRDYVVLEDPLAGGLELVQGNFATERSRLQAGSEERSWWGDFDHFEAYDDRVALYADELEAGVHRYTYYVRAAFPGRYLWPGAHAEEMYQPEVFGRTSSTEIVIR